MTHIIEVNEHLDYQAFWHTPGRGLPHGRVSTSDAGHAFWEITQGLADSYPCSPCKPGAQALTHGGHDVVNILLGKQVKTPQHLKALFAMVDEARRKREHCTGGKCK